MSKHRDAQGCRGKYKCARGCTGMHNAMLHEAAHGMQEEHGRDAQGMHTGHRKSMKDTQGGRCTGMSRGCKEDGWGSPREAEEGDRGHTEGDEDVWMKQVGPRMGQEAAQGSPGVWQSRRAVQGMPEGGAGDLQVPQGCGGCTKDAPGIHEE